MGGAGVMLYEFAIEPEHLNQIAGSRRDCADFRRFFSVGSPNVVSDYPKLKNVRKTLRSLLDGSDTNRKKLLEELIKFLGVIPRVKREGAYDGSCWLRSMVQENERVAFDYVLSERSDDRLKMISFQRLCENGVFYPSQLPVRRVAPEMAAAIANALRLASKVVLVDPYFNDRPSKWKPFIHFLDVATRERPGKPVDLEVQFGADKSKTAHPQYLANKLQSEAPQLLQSCEVAFKSIRERAGSEKLHNRYVLTDIGGIFFGIGLDEEDENHRDDVALLNDDLFKLRWEQYVEGVAFDTVARSVVSASQINRD
jgi:hypothetical protein